MSEEPVPDAGEVARQTPQGKLPVLGLSALGIVFGDIGTSPLYTFKTVLGTAEVPSDVATVLGALSLVLWTLFIITTIKYVSFAMRVDNDGEGGILALMALLGVKKQHRPTIVAFGLFGAALIYGDGAITPAISVLSALEGLNMATPALQPYVVPAAVAILVALFAIQSQGTAAIGHFFGPVMLIWFAAMAAMGISGIVQHPAVFAALNPVYGLTYLFSHGVTGFLVLGAVFLCVTGAEALYADMGHFGSGPIKLAWFAIVFPSLILNYAGQAALVLEGAPTDGNIFFRLCPAILLIPLIVLATVATIIASQSIITGAFSMTRQAIQLGWLPRLLIKQTSSEGYGQIYVGVVNWLLMIVTVGLTIAFGKSDNLAAAYGIAVSADHADDLGAALHRDARDLGLERAGCRRRSRPAFWSSIAPSSSPTSPRSPRAAMCRLHPGRLRLRRDVDLAPRRGRDLDAHARSADPGRGIHGRHLPQGRCRGCPARPCS